MVSLVSVRVAREAWEMCDDVYVFVHLWFYAFMHVLACLMV
jgi:hypothetical protein